MHFAWPKLFTIGKFVTTLNRMISEPPANSRQMRAYLQAALEVTGMLAGERFPLEFFMKNFRTHLQPKAIFPHPTLRRTADGMYVLTPEGYTYFTRRLTPDPIVAGQKVGRTEVLEMLRAILAPRPLQGWASFEAQLSSNQ